MNKTTEFKAEFEVTPALNENEKIFFNNFNEARTDNKSENFKSNWKATTDGKIEWEGKAPIDLSKDNGQEMVALALKEMCLLKAMEEEKGLTMQNYQFKDLKGDVLAKGSKPGEFLKVELNKDEFHVSQGKVKEENVKQTVVSENDIVWSDRVKVNYEEILEINKPKMK